MNMQQMGDTCPRGRPRARLQRPSRVAALCSLPALLLMATVALAQPTGGADQTRDQAAGSPAKALSSSVKPGHLTIWTCPMHPQIRRDKPGRCPLCGMALVLVTEGEAQEAGPRQLEMSEAAKKLAEIQTTPVVRKFVKKTVRLVGKIHYNEQRVAYITSYIPGRIDRLYVDYTGIAVRKGDHMASLYSPELLAAQKELQEAARALKELEKSTVDIVKETARGTLTASREKLRLWGLSAEQIADIEARGTVVDHITIYAPLGGIVIKKTALEGQYVKTGERIYTIADLSQVWVKLDAYESELPWIRYGQHVRFEAEAYPGETFEGRIAFIDPFLNERTRTVRVRVNVPNRDGKLKPGMFVRARVTAEVAAAGKVMSPRLANKWICPMHPEVVKDKPGKCDTCGMPLATAESLGYVSATKTVPPLVIPRTAPLITGRRAVVYVEVLGAKSPTFEGRVVTLGPRAGDYYLVRDGLAEGERVVTRGNFKIDSALQIMAKPSMMSPEGGGPAPGHHHGAPANSGAAPPARETAPSAKLPPQLRKALGGNVASAYFGLADDLVGADTAKAKADAAKLADAIRLADRGLSAGLWQGPWKQRADELAGLAAAIADATDLARMRESFALLSDALAAALEQLGHDRAHALYRLHCPMAFEGRGAWWLQPDKEPRNPYFGEAMLKCADKVEPIPPASVGGSPE